MVLSMKDLLQDSQLLSVTNALPSNPEPELLFVLPAFLENHNRWQSHLLLAYLSGMAGANLEESFRRVLWNKYRRPYQAAADVVTDDEIMSDMASLGRHFDGDGDRIAKSLPIDLAFSGNALLQGDLVGNTVSLVFESQVISAWTMFETLAADMWVAVVNAHPVPLAGLVGKENRIANLMKKPDDAPELDGEDSDDESCGEFIAINSTKTVGLQHLHNLTRGDFNLSQKMGSLMVMAERVKFTSISGIRSAYSLSFLEKYNVRPREIDKALSSRSLDALALVRNVIVHRAGKADDEYIDKQTQFPNVPILMNNERVNLDSKTSRSLIDPVVEISLQLIKAVNSWIVMKNAIKPQKRPPS